MTALHDPRSTGGTSAMQLVRQSDKDKVKICIVGFYGANSTGDNAILTQFIREMAPNRDVNLTIITQNAARAYEIFAQPNVSTIEHRRLFGQGGLRNLLKGR